MYQSLKNILYLQKLKNNFIIFFNFPNQLFIITIFDSYTTLLFCSTANHAILYTFLFLLYRSCGEEEEEGNDDEEETSNGNGEEEGGASIHVKCVFI